MMIKVKYFASLREEIGRDSDQVTTLKPLSAEDVWKEATGRDSITDNLLIALNHEYVSEDTLVNDGDELAFFPPVTGG